MKAISSMVANTDKENIYGLIKKLIIKANGSMIKWMEEDNFIILMEDSILEILKIICFMEMVFLNGLMDKNMSDNLVLIKNKVKGFIIGMTVENFKEIGIVE